MEQDHKLVVLHLDIDAFYAQVEENYNPALRGKPLGVYQKNIVVTSNYVAREYGIKKCMLTAEAIKLCPALVLVNGENLEKYREISSNITKHIQSKYNVDVEKLGFDENFVDITKLVEEEIKNCSREQYEVIDKDSIPLSQIGVVSDDDDDDDEDFRVNGRTILMKNGETKDSDNKCTDLERELKQVEGNKRKSNELEATDCVGAKRIKTSQSNIKEENTTYDVIGHIYNNIPGKCSCGCTQRLTIGTHIANTIREDILVTFKLTLSAGISYNKLTSKLIGSLHKPNQQTVLFPVAVLDLMSGINLKQIPGIGSKMYERLLSLGITSIEMLQNVSKSVLSKEFDSTTCDWLMNISYGKDTSAVKNFKKQSSIGVEDRYHKGVNTSQEFITQTRILLKRLLILIRKDGRSPKLLKLSLRFDHFKFEFKLDSKQCPINPRVFSNPDLCIIEDYLLDISTRLYKDLCAKKNSKLVTYINLALANFIEISTTNSILKFCQKNASIGSIYKNSNVDQCTQSFTNSQDVILANDTRSHETSHEDIYNIPRKSEVPLKLQSNDEMLSVNNIDTSVLNELPEDIRKEIEQDQMYRAPRTNNSPHLISPAPKSDISTKKSHFQISELGFLKPACNTAPSPSSMNTTDCASNSSSDGTGEASVIVDNDTLDVNNIDASVLSELPEDIRREIEQVLRTAQSKHSSSQNKQTSSFSASSHGKTKKKTVKQLSMLNFVQKK